MQYARASRFALHELTALWNQGYEGYFLPIRFTEEQFRRWSEAGDFDLEHSLVMVDGEKPVGFSFLGVRGRRGWIGGFGIVPEYRGKGLASQLFSEHIGIIEQLGLDRVQLEVLTQNWAQKVYARAGFVIIRRLSVLQGTLPEMPAGEEEETLTPDEVLAHSDRLHAAAPAVWQREPAWLSRSMPEQAAVLHTGPKEQPTAYALYVTDGTGVRILDAAAEGTGSAAELVARLAQRCPGQPVTLVNEPEGSPVHQAFTAAGCHEVHSQYEMSWTNPDTEA